MVYFTNLRRSSLLSNLLLSSLNLLLLFLSSASFVPIFLFRTSPTSFGWALVTVSATTLLSSLVGFYSRLTHLCFITHVSLVLASSVGQVLGFLSLFLRHDSSLGLLGSVRSPKEQWVLLVVEEMLLLAMFVMQSVALILTCVVEKRWAREYEEVEAEREAAARKRSWRMTRVQEEAMANAAAMAEVKGRELDEKMKAKYGQWVKNEFEEC